MIGSRWRRRIVAVWLAPDPDTKETHRMLQWHPKLVALLTAIVLVAAAVGGAVEALVDGLTW